MGASEHGGELDRMDLLVEAVYGFLISEGYHGHYPSAEEQAEKFVAFPPDADQADASEGQR